MDNYTFEYKKPSYMRQMQEEIQNEKTREIIEILTDENFGSEAQRKRFIDLMTSLFNISDNDARKFIRELGKACSSIGGNMLGDREPVVDDAINANDELEIEDEQIEELEEVPSYFYRKSGTMSYESIVLHPLSDEDAREIQVYLQDSSIKFRNKRDLSLIPSIMIDADKNDSKGRALLEKLRNIAKFDEV